MSVYDTNFKIYAIPKFKKKKIDKYIKDGDGSSRSVIHIP